MKVALIGGGGFRVPTVYGAILDAAKELSIDELVLQDLDAGRLETISAVLLGLSRERGEEVAFRATSELEDAVEGSDFVFVAIRVGGLEGRVVDERVPLEHGVLGQETTGPAGVAFALRTVPVMTRIAEVVASRAPDAWLLNFTNPAGLVTEAVQSVLGDRAIGICDSPTALCRRVAAALGRSAEGLWFDYFGLNHLGWLRSVRDGRGDLLPDLLADDDRLMLLEEARLFGSELLREIGMIPNEYLYYRHFPSETSGAIDTIGRTRAEFLLEQQERFYAAARPDPSRALAEWRRTRDERHATYMQEARDAAGVDEHEGSASPSPGPMEDDEDRGYAGVAVDLMRAIALDATTVLILNVANRSSLPFLDGSAVVEVPCVVGRAGAVPVAVGEIPSDARRAIESVKQTERLVIRASREGSSHLAVRALRRGGFVGSEEVARSIFAQYRARTPEIAERFT
jgi:6-phospho-beta-glucosidase